MVKRISLKRMYLPGSPQRSSARREKERFVVVHHMTIVGNGNGGALETCRRVWRSRVASANAGVDGTRAAAFVHGERASWATATTHGNHAGYNIEHANSSAGPTWGVSEATRRTGARLAGQRCYDKKLGRPKSGTTIRKHSDFFPTACPGPYLSSSKVWAAYVAEAADFYDQLGGKKTRQAYTIYVAKEPGDFVERPVIVRSGPGKHYTNLGVKKHGDLFTASGKTARTKSGSLWRQGKNGGWVADRRLKEKKS